MIEEMLGTCVVLSLCLSPCLFFLLQPSRTSFFSLLSHPISPFSATLVFNETGINLTRRDRQTSDTHTRVPEREVHYQFDLRDWEETSDQEFALKIDDGHGAGISPVDRRDFRAIVDHFPSTL